ncbi:MAG: hypothetical protein NZ520_03040 [bacterium]|nr:hypothetical protein [bacterium]
MRKVCLILLLLLLTSARAQRVVVVCLQPEELATLSRLARSLPGAQALLLNYAPLPSAQRLATLPPEQWERSAYLTLNAGARVLIRSQLAASADGQPVSPVQPLQSGTPAAIIGLLPGEMERKGVYLRYLTTLADSPMLLASAPLPNRYTFVLPDHVALLQEARTMLKQHSRLMLWLDLREAQWTQVARAVRELSSLLNPPDDALYLLSPAPAPRQVASGSRLGWVLRLQDGQSGLLTTSSTRLPGFLILPDLTATWIDHFQRGSIPPQVVGSPARVVPARDPVQTVERLHGSLMRQVWWQERIGMLPTIQLVALLLAWLLWYRFRVLVRPLWLFPCAVPLLGVSLVPVLVCFPLGGISMEARAGIWGGCLLALLVVLSRFALRQSLRALAVALLIFASVGLLHGSGLLRWSGFGYVLQYGARFYGVGNETAGSLMGAQSLFLATESAGWSLLRWLLTAVALGAPFLGANVGAMLSALGVACSRALLLRRSRTAALMALGATLLAVILWERLSPDPTHLGKALQHLPSLLSAIERKLGMNLSLILSSAWTPLLLFGLAGLKGAPVPVWVGAIALLVLNDSGVLAAAAMLVWWWAWRMAQQEAHS